MKREYYILDVALLLIITAVSCEKDMDYMDDDNLTITNAGYKSMLVSPAGGALFVTDLLAGRSTDVGRVEVWNDAEYLYVRYIIDSDLTPGDITDDGALTLITETHLSVGTSMDAMPVNRGGNPAPGKFEYSGKHFPGVREYTYKIERTWDAGTPLVLAAHAVVEKTGGVPGLEISLPETVNLNVYYPGTAGEPSYFDAVVTGGSMLDGIYDSWCIDTDNVIYSGSNYTYIANVYSSYEAMPDGIMEQPGNLDLVNWVINQGFVGRPSLYPEVNGNYTMGDVQVAIWTLIDDEISTSVGAYNMVRVNEIIDAAAGAGEEFVPECTEKIAVVIVPVNGAQVTIAQVTFIEVKLPCDDLSETAWAAGRSFRGKSWATWFEYIVE